VTTLADVCELIIDSEHKTAPKAPEGYPMVRTTDIERGKLNLRSALRVGEAAYRSWTARAVPKPSDLILAREAPVGNVGIIPPGAEPCLGQRTVLLRPNQGLIEPLYLNYLLSGPELRGRMEALSNGSTVPHLNMGDIRLLELPKLPVLSTQRRIASILSAYDDLIENNTRRIQILEEMAQAIYREWFVEFRFPGHEGARMVDSELGPIPEGWQVAAIGDTVKTLGGGTPSRDVAAYWQGGAVTWYTPTDLTKSGTMFIEDSAAQITELGLARSSATLFPAGSVMMTSRATIGVVAISVPPAATNQGFIICVPNDVLGQYHLYFWLKSNVELFL